MLKKRQKEKKKEYLRVVFYIEMNTSAVHRTRVQI